MYLKLKNKNNNYPKGTIFKEIIKNTDNIAVAFLAFLIIGLSVIKDNLSKILSLSFNDEFSYIKKNV